MFINETTPRADLLEAVNSDINLVDAFIKAGLSEEETPTDQIREFIISWIEAGDECAAA